jgi:hypothetical protein
VAHWRGWHGIEETGRTDHLVLHFLTLRGHHGLQARRLGGRHRVAGIQLQRLRQQPCKWWMRHPHSQALPPEALKASIQSNYSVEAGMLQALKLFNALLCWHVLRVLYGRTPTAVLRTWLW